ncbi:hypothetical protein BRADI_2g38615v3 [Brachypodium distachyon]|uniref:Uncharacterized protein n=1 Tax=Brachypodium distachyon TaxID=15368 RepID=A0A2K2DCN9_BRADI|nr:hypothetical protein BRADI_2g38615v3 [Brachypodium distachyon]
MYILAVTELIQFLNLVGHTLSGWVDCSLARAKKFFVEGLGAIFWDIWRSRNATCFEKKVIHCPEAVFWCRERTTFLDFFVSLAP